MQRNSAQMNSFLGGHDADANDSEMDDAVDDDSDDDTPVKEGIL